MIKRIAVIAAIAISALSAAQADGGVSVDAWVGASAGDVLAEPGASASLGVVFGGLFGKDIEAGIDELTWGIAPEMSLGFDAFYSSSFAFGESPLSLSAGSVYSFAFDDAILVDALTFAALGVAVGDVEVANLELDLGYMSANEFAISLSIILGAGYAFDFGAVGSISAWASIDADLLGGFAVGDPELEIEYSLPIGERYALSAAIVSAFALGEEPSVSLEPSIAFSASF